MNFFELLYQQKFRYYSEEGTEQFFELIRSILSRIDDALEDVVFDVDEELATEIQQFWTNFYNSAGLSFEQHFIPALVSRVFECFAFDPDNEEVLDDFNILLQKDLEEEFGEEWLSFVEIVDDERFVNA